MWGSMNSTNTEKCRNCGHFHIDVSYAEGYRKVLHWGSCVEFDEGLIDSVLEANLERLNSVTP